DCNQVVLRKPRETEASLGVAIAVLVVELVAMTVTLAHDLVSVDGTRQRVRPDEHVLRAEAHRAALGSAVVALLLALRGVLPFGDERDHRVRARSIELGAIGVLEP